MPTKHPAPGATVYDLTGRAGRYVAHAAGGHIVEPLYDTGDDDEEQVMFGNAETWRDAFDKPPTERLHAEVAELQQKTAEARRQLDEVRQQRRAEDAEHAAKLARLKKHAHLSRIDDYIEGRITHYVVQERYGDAIYVKTAEQMFNKGDPHRGRMPLLVLFGDPYHDREMRDTEWCLVTDGPDRKLMPCTSLEEALAKAQTEVDKVFAAWRKDGTSAYSLVRHARAALAGGLQVPADVMAEVELRERAAVDTELAKARTELQKAQAALAAAEAKVAAVSEPATA